MARYIEGARGPFTSYQAGHVYCPTGVGYPSGGTSIPAVQGLMSTTGVRSKASVASMPIIPDFWSIDVMITAAIAMGFGRTGERSANTPRKSDACLGACTIRSRRPRSIQYSIQIERPMSNPKSPAA